LRIKEQETRLTLQEHHDVDDDEHSFKITRIVKPRNLAATAKSPSRLAAIIRKVTVSVLEAEGVGVGINCTDLHRAFRAKSCRLCNQQNEPTLLLGRMHYTGDRRCTRHYFDAQTVRRGI